MDDDRVPDWYRPYERSGVAELKSFDDEGSSGHLSSEQERALSDWVDAHCPLSIRKVEGFLNQTFGVSYSRGGLIALLHRLGFDYRKPERMPRSLGDAKEQVDAGHPTHQVRLAGCWDHKSLAIAVERRRG